MKITAKAGFYSSVVGMAVHIHERPGGRMIGQLALVGFQHDRAGAERTAEQIAKALNRCDDLDW